MSIYEEKEIYKTLCQHGIDNETEFDRIGLEVEEVAKGTKQLKMSIQDMYKIGINGNEEEEKIIDTVMECYKFLYVRLIGNMLERQEVDENKIDIIVDRINFKESNQARYLDINVNKLCTSGLIDLESISKEFESINKKILKIGDIKFIKGDKENYDKILLEMFQKELNIKLKELNPKKDKKTTKTPTQS